MKTLSLALILAALFAQSAFATAAHYESDYWIALNFSQSAFGKQVTAVTAQLKAVTDSGTTAFQSSAPIPMSLVVQGGGDAGHFFGKTQFTVATTDDLVSGVFVSYTVSFADGSASLTTAPALVPLTVSGSADSSSSSSSSVNDLVGAENSLFSSMTDTSATQGIQIPIPQGPAN